MRYFKLDKFDSADGPGIRVGLYVSGCTHKCKGCHSSEFWDFSKGEVFSIETIGEIKRSLLEPHCAGLSILGGDPLESKNVKGICRLLENLQDWYNNIYHKPLNVWLWTGDTYEHLTELVRNENDKYTEEERFYLKGILQNITVLVDGPFIESERDLNIEFRGSRNQRLINMQKTLDYNGYYNNVSEFGTKPVVLVERKGFEYV